MGKYNCEGLRAVSLLRVSTDKQTNGKEKDIPEQRNILEKFIKQEGLIHIKEFVDGGISGYKIAMDDRDSLQTIKAMAIKKEFDVLVSYLPDRIGRQSLETSLVVKFLNSQGIRVITTEKELKTDDGTDMLLTFLSYWKSEEEAKTISKRSSDYQIQAICNGQFRGGGKKSAPYGYDVIPAFTRNTKGRLISDLQINPEESKVVKMIFDMSLKYNWGSRKIAAWLNLNGYKDKSREGRGWIFQTIDRMLVNKTYMGYLHMFSKKENKEIVSPKREDLIIIPENLWRKNISVIANRKKCRDNKLKGIGGVTNSRVLLSGLCWCGYCGRKLYAWTNHKYRYNKEGEVVSKRKYDYYKCKADNTRGLDLCSGQRCYSAKRIEAIVEEYSKKHINDILNGKITLNSLLQNQKKKIEDIKQSIINEEKLLKENEEQLDKLKKEISLSLLNKSVFQPEDLKSAMDLIKIEINKNIENIATFNIDINNIKADSERYDDMDIIAENWIDEYILGDIDTKKMLLNQIIERITIKKDDVQVEFHLNILNGIL